MRKQRNGERGVALLLTMVTLLIVTAIGFSMMFQTDTETIINSNFRDQQVAYYAAAAGLEEARARMATDATASISANLPTTLASPVLYVINSGGTIQPWNTSSSNQYFDYTLCSGNSFNGVSAPGDMNCGSQVPTSPSPWYLSQSADSAYAANPVIPYKWTRIVLKRNRSAAGTSNTMYVNGGTSGTFDQAVCWNGTNEIVLSGGCTTTNWPVYLVTTLAVTSMGTRRMLQYELTQDSLGNINFPSAMTLAGGNTTLSAVDSPSGNNYHIEGNDHLGCGATTLGSPVAAIGVTSDADATNVIGVIPNGRRNNYFNTVQSTPDVENISSSLPSDLQSVSSLEALLATIKSKTPAANQFTTNQTSLSNPGTATSPRINYVDGNLSLGGTMTGYGILVVTGTLSLGGDVGWKGIILVVGQGILNGNGGGSNVIEGALLIAKTRDPSGNLLSSLGSATYDWTGGGGNGIHYSSGCVNQAQTFPNYRIISARELMY